MSVAPTPTWFSQRQRLIARTIAAVSSIITVLLAFVTFYWFVRMKKRFRHMCVLMG